jgi:hypothetical protein
MKEMSAKVAGRRKYTDAMGSATNRTVWFGSDALARIIHWCRIRPTAVARGLVPRQGHGAGDKLPRYVVKNPG